MHQGRRPNTLRYSHNRILISNKNEFSFKIIILSERKHAKKQHTTWFHLYKTLEHINHSTVTENRSGVSGDRSRGRNGLQRDTKNLLDKMEISWLWQQFHSIWHTYVCQSRFYCIRQICAVYCTSVIPQ